MPVPDTSGTLWQFKRNEQNMNNGNPADVTTDDSTSLKYKSSLGVVNQLSMEY